MTSTSPELVRLARSWPAPLQQFERWARAAGFAEHYVQAGVSTLWWRYWLQAWRDIGHAVDSGKAPF